MRDRALLVQELIHNPKSVASIVHELAEHGVECEGHLGEVAKVDVLAVLKQYDNGTLSAAEIVAWANSLQGRMDVGFEFGEEGVVEEAVFWLANPTLNWPIDADIHRRIASLFERRVVKRT